jgi:hypothetical protein
MNDPQRPRRRVVVLTGRRPPAELRAVRALVLEDPNPETSYLDQEELTDRKEEYEAGDFSFVGVRIEAEVTIDATTQVLRSPGLWGIESDADEEEIDRIIADEWEALRSVLKTVGVPTSQLPLAPEREWIEWRT